MLPGYASIVLKTCSKFKWKDYTENDYSKTFLVDHLPNVNEFHKLTVCL